MAKDKDTWWGDHTMVQPLFLQPSVRSGWGCLHSQQGGSPWGESCLCSLGSSPNQIPARWHPPHHHPAQTQALWRLSLNFTFLTPPRPSRGGPPDCKICNQACSTRLSGSTAVLPLIRKEHFLCFSIFKCLRWCRFQATERFERSTRMVILKGRGGTRRLQDFNDDAGGNLSIQAWSEKPRETGSDQHYCSLLLAGTWGWGAENPVGFHGIKWVFLGRPCSNFVSKEVTEINLHFKITWQGHL